MPPANQEYGNLNSHRPKNTKEIDVASEYKAIGQSHTVKRKQSKFAGDLKLQEDSLSNMSGSAFQSFNTSKNKKNDSRAFEVASSGKNDLLKIDGLFKEESSDEEQTRSKASSPVRSKKALRRKKSQISKRLSSENE